MNETIDQLRAILREDPASRQFVALGRALIEAGEFDEAAGVLEEGLRHHPRLAEGWLVLATVELERDDLKAVEAAAARALDIDPENAEAARLIARVASRRGDWKRALSAWRLTLALAPEDPEASDGVAEAQRRLAGPAAAEPRPEPAPVPGAEPSTGEEPFGGIGAEVASEPEAPPPPPVLPREVVAVAEPEDPFATGPSGDTGVWFAGSDVFLVEEAVSGSEAVTSPDEPFAAPAAAGEAVFGEPGASEIGPETPSVEEAFAAPADETPEPGAAEETPFADAEVPGEVLEPAAPAVEAVPAAAGEASPFEAEPVEEETPASGEPAGEPAVVEAPAVESEPVPAPPAATTEATPPTGMPLPTVTLARLALQQGDTELARRTLEQVVALRGESDETRELAARIAASEGVDRSVMVARRKVERLQAWMQAVRLAVESRDHGV